MAEGASRASPASGAAPETGNGKVLQASGKDLPAAATSSDDMPVLPTDIQQNLAAANEQLLAAVEASAADTGTITGTATGAAVPPTPVTESGQSVTNELISATTGVQARLLASDDAVPGVATPRAAVPGEAELPALGSTVASSAGGKPGEGVLPHAPELIRPAALNPAAVTATGEPIVIGTGDARSTLSLPLERVSRQAPGYPGATVTRRAADIAADQSAMRATTAAATTGPVDEVLVSLAGDAAQGDASRFAMALAEGLSRESAPGRSGAGSAPLAAGSVPAGLQVATVDSVPGAKPGVLPTLHAVPGDPAFATELAGRVSVLVKDGLSEARLQLNPPELGRLDVRIASEGDQTRVLFTVQGAEARDAIEQAMPRLRDMLEQSGLQLSRFDVATDSHSRQGNGDSATFSAAELGQEDADFAEGERALPAAATRSQSLVDYYV